MDTAMKPIDSGTVRREAMELAEHGASADADNFERALAAIKLVYQPIVCWSRQRVAGYEALLRSADTSLPHAGVLIAAAEHFGRVLDLGRSVRGKVAVRLMDAPDFDVFVNLHSRDLLDENLFSEDAPLSHFADRVVLEITERASLDEVHDVTERLGRLRALGFRIALDDLGAGYAGLSSFILLQPDVVKIDMSLVRDVDADPVRRRLIALMVQLCRELRTVLVVEGVETIAERDTLVELGCDLFQGYLFARPGPPFPSVPW